MSGIGISVVPIWYSCAYCPIFYTAALAGDTGSNDTTATAIRPTGNAKPNQAAEIACERNVRPGGFHSKRKQSGCRQRSYAGVGAVRTTISGISRKTRAVVAADTTISGASLSLKIC
jgi:hypothetical protein